MFERSIAWDTGMDEMGVSQDDIASMWDLVY
jgi:hypothetical protein